MKAIPLAEKVGREFFVRPVDFRWPVGLGPDMHPAPEEGAIAQRCTTDNEFEDEDGIVCPCPYQWETIGSVPLRTVPIRVCGYQWSASTERRRAANHPNGRALRPIENCLRDGFSQRHCKLFRNRPFIWHLRDGLKDGFHAFVNCYCLAGPKGEGRGTIAPLNYAYLNAWTLRRRAERQSGVPTGPTPASNTCATFSGSQNAFWKARSRATSSYAGSPSAPGLSARNRTGATGSSWTASHSHSPNSGRAGAPEPGSYAGSPILSAARTAGRNPRNSGRTRNPRGSGDFRTEEAWRSGRTSRWQRTRGSTSNDGMGCTARRP